MVRSNHPVRLLSIHGEYITLPPPRRWISKPSNQKVFLCISYSLRAMVQVCCTPFFGKYWICTIFEPSAIGCVKPAMTSTSWCNLYLCKVLYIAIMWLCNNNYKDDHAMFYFAIFARNQLAFLIMNKKTNVKGRAHGWEKEHTCLKGPLYHIWRETY